MGNRGPSSKSSIKVLSPIKIKRPNPLPGMSTKARTVWLRIVSAYPPDHFKPQHYDQLRAFCEASGMHKEASEALMKSSLLVKQPNGVIKENPYIGIMDKMAGRMQGLAVKLGITCNNTMVAKGNTGEAPKQKSARSKLLFNG